MFDSTNLEIATQWWILSDIKKTGEIVVPAKILANVIGSTKENKINLEVEDNNLTIKDKKNKTVIQGLEKEDFPVIPEVKKDSKKKIIIKSEKIKEGLSKVVNCVASSNIRPEISGVLMNFSKKELTLVATDSYRLTRKVISLDNKSSVKESVILPQETAQQLINILSQTQGDLEIYIDDNQILFEMSMEETDHPQFQLTSRLIEGHYPDYDSIIPNNGEITINVSRNELLDQVKTTSIFSGKINEIKFIIEKPKKGKIQIEAMNSKFGQSESSVNAQIKGDPIKISFNHRYLSDALKTISTKDIVIHLIDDEKPALIKPVDDDSYLYVLMPLKAT